MNDNNILVSIVVPTYNRALTIDHTLNSIIGQSYLNWECLVVDDNSIDTTKDLILKLNKDDKRIKYFKNTRKKGGQGARNTGVINAKSDWIVFFDSDDYMHPDFILKMTTHLKMKDVDIVTCFSDLIDINTNTKVGRFNFINEGNIHDGLYNNKCYADSNAAIIRKSKLFDIGLLDEDSPAFQEWDTHIRLSRNCTYSTLNEVLVNYYKGGDDTLSINKMKTIRGFYYILNKHKDYWRRYHDYNFIQFGKDAIRHFKRVDDISFIKEYKHKFFELDSRFKREYVKIILKQFLVDYKVIKPGFILRRKTK